MEIHVRNVDPNHVTEIDKRCKGISKRLGKRYSRSDYINEVLRQHIDEEFGRNKDDKFDIAVRNLSISLERQEMKLQEYIDSTNELIGVIADKEN
ncbi:hypothetical protein CON22_17840 [Bacillus cereus]|nr:hypothetical protein CON22_17840 [Bacillus cereus]